MKSIARVLSAIIFAVPFGAGAVVPGTVGSNLTAFNNNSGSANNNRWNAMTNARAVSADNAPSADFGNCNAVIMRCAQPKCAGCTTMEIATPIVEGCVQSNEACKQYGKDLVQYMAAQLVANAGAKQAAAQNQAAAMAAQQANSQIQQMQAQMQQMQQDMARQNAATVESLQAALEEQRELTAQAIADAAAASASTSYSASGSYSDSGGAAGTDLTAAQIAAAQNGVSSDILMREQITGEIYTNIENAELAMNALKTTMQSIFAYAGCDSKGNNCTGPKRVKVFKERAMQFFEPYENVLDQMYDALLIAQDIGVDITDIYMMLNDSCNVWGQYMCQPGQILHYTAFNCENGYSVPRVQSDPVAPGKYESFTVPVNKGVPCTPGQIVPLSNGGCQLIKTLSDKAEVQRNWLYPDDGEYGAKVRVGCASEALSSSTLFRNRKRAANIDIETLQRIIEQDAPSSFGGVWGGNISPQRDGIKFCAVSPKSLQDLQKAASLKTLPDKVCKTDTQLTTDLSTNGVATSEQAAVASGTEAALVIGGNCQTDDAACKCSKAGGFLYMNGECNCGSNMKYVDGACVYDPDAFKQSAYSFDTYDVALKKISGTYNDVMSLSSTTKSATGGTNINTNTNVMNLKIQ